MQAWAGIAVAQLTLLALALRRVRIGLRETPARAVSWPGVAVLVAAVLAASVMVADGGWWAVVALFGTVVLAADVLLLRGAAVAALCTRAVTSAPERDA